MKRLVLGIMFVLAVVGAAAAAPKTETFDVTTFAPPSGWKRTARDVSVELAIIDNTAGAAASIRIYGATAAAADARANFDKAWTEVVTLPDVPAPTVAAATKRDGWDVVRGTAKYTFSERPASTTLLAATRNSTYVLVVVSVVGAKYQKDVDKVLASLRFAAPAAAVTAPTVGAAQQPTAPKVEVSGAWGFSTGGQMGYGPVAPWLRESREYVFDGKGNYTFLRRYDVNQEPQTTITRERGTYTLTGNTLTVTPSKCEREVWSKPNGHPEQNPYDKLVKREKLALEKTTYRVGYEPHEDGTFDNLVLTPPAATQREGIFNAAGRYRFFRPDGKYYTAIHPTP